MKRTYIITLLIALTLICGLHIANLSAGETLFNTYQIWVKSDTNIVFYAFAPTDAQFNVIMAQAKAQGIADTSFWIHQTFYGFTTTDSTDTLWFGYIAFDCVGESDSSLTLGTEWLSRCYWQTKLGGYAPVYTPVE